MDLSKCIEIQFKLCVKSLYDKSYYNSFTNSSIQFPFDLEIEYDRCVKDTYRMCNKYFLSVKSTTQDKQPSENN